MFLNCLAWGFTTAISSKVHPHAVAEDDLTPEEQNIPFREEFSEKVEGNSSKLYF